MLEYLPLSEIEALGIAAACGLLIGVEREYHNKSTGIRTLVLIALGAALFGILSRTGSRSDDRIAANIVTGIGFLGAGVIFKDRLSVLGLTTAAVIWATAAIGLAAGMGHYNLAVFSALLVLVSLLLLHPVEAWVNKLPQKKTVTISFSAGGQQKVDLVLRVARENRLRAQARQISKKNENTIVVLELYGRPDHMSSFEKKLLDLPEVASFH